MISDKELIRYNARRPRSRIGWEEGTGVLVSCVAEAHLSPDSLDRWLRRSGFRRSVALCPKGTLPRETSAKQPYFGV